MPPIELLVVTHLHPKTSLPSSVSFLCSNTERFQSSLTYKCYKAAALRVRALKASTLMAYQLDLEEDMTERRFLKGACCKLPTSRPADPLWDLPIVLLPF